MARKKFIDFGALRNIPILEVAEGLGMELVPVGAGVHALKDPQNPHVPTSLRIFKNSNRWKRFSGVSQGGVDGGSTIDLVMHMRNVDQNEAASWLKDYFAL